MCRSIGYCVPALPVLLPIVGVLEVGVLGEVRGLKRCVRATKSNKTKQPSGIGG